jgi:putative transposase
MEFFHLLNRGVDKRDVFLDDADRVRFIRGLFLFNDHQYVSSTTRKDKSGKTLLVTPRELLVQIHAFCLMTNHYHILVSAIDNNEENISLFMKKLNKGYSRYFNEKYKRTGALWEGKYKKVHIVRDGHFLYIPYYIHLNPLDFLMPEWRKGTVKNPKKALEYLQTYRWSSHLDYLGVKNFPSVLYTDVLRDKYMIGPRKSYEKELIYTITRENTPMQGISIE